MAESINLKDLGLSLEESRDIIEFLARRRNVSNYEHMTNEELLSTLKKNPQKQIKLRKQKNNQILTPQLPRNVAKLKINQNLTLHRPIKIAKRRKTQNLSTQKSLKLGKCKNSQYLTYEKPSQLTKCENLTTHKRLKLGKRKNTQNFTYEKPSKLTKRKNLTLQKQLKTTKQEKSKNNQQQIISKNKERTDVIREELKELIYKLSKGELKEIKKRLYMVENKKGLLGSKRTKKYLDELDEKIRNWINIITMMILSLEE